MFTLICCSLAGLKMSLRTGFCCRNVLAQDKIKVRRKLYLSLPHIGILGVPSPNCMLHLQFWDGALLPPAVLGWHLLTCKFFTPSHLQIFHLQYCAYSPAVFFWQIFHMQFWDGTVQGCQIHRKKIINGIMAVLPQRLHVSRWKCKIHRKQKCSKESWYKSLEKNAKLTENKNDQCNHATNLPLKMRQSTKTNTINGIMLQIFRKKRESQQKQKWSIEPKNNLQATQQSPPMPLAARH